MSEPVQATVKHVHKLQDYDEMIQAVETLNNLEIPFTLIYQPNALGSDTLRYHQWVFEIRVTGELLAPEKPAQTEMPATQG